MGAMFLLPTHDTQLPYLVIFFFLSQNIFHLSSHQTAVLHSQLGDLGSSTRYLMQGSRCLQRNFISNLDQYQAEAFPDSCFSLDF